MSKQPHVWLARGQIIVENTDGVAWAFPLPSPHPFIRGILAIVHQGIRDTIGV